MDRDIDELLERAKAARERAQGTQLISMLLGEQSRRIQERVSRGLALVAARSRMLSGACGD